MRKNALIILLLLIKISDSFGQGHYVISHVLDATKKHYYVGSLAESSSNVVQKLKIDVFGGNFTNTDSGTNTYSITTRTAKIINIEKTGGSTNGYELKVFKNGTTYDFVIEINSSYVSLFVQSWLINGGLNAITAATPVKIERYDQEGKTDVTSSFTERIMIVTDQNGNIGIGTLSPKSKLDVRGKIIADEVEIKVNKGADFVFESDYNLPTLFDVENHIKENRHLPDIPSQKEMIENGVNISEMQIKLLQKVEELTLYVIEQNKQIQILQKENQEIKNQLNDK